MILLDVEQFEEALSMLCGDLAERCLGMDSTAWEKLPLPGGLGWLGLGASIPSPMDLLSAALDGLLVGVQCVSLSRDTMRDTATRSRAVFQTGGEGVAGRLARIADDALQPRKFIYIASSLAWPVLCGSSPTSRLDCIGLKQQKKRKGERA